MELEEYRQIVNTLDDIYIRMIWSNTMDLVYCLIIIFVITKSTILNDQNEGEKK